MSLPAWKNMRGSVLSLCVLAVGCAGSSGSPKHSAAGTGGEPVAGSSVRQDADRSSDASNPPSDTHDVSTASGEAGKSSDDTRDPANAPAAPSGGAPGAGTTKAKPPAAGSGGLAGTAAPASPPMLTVIASTLLMRPSDLEFNPYVNDELWLMNFDDSSAAIIAQASTNSRSIQRRQDPEGAEHFMPKPAAFAFGGRETTIVDAQGKPVEGTFATCPDFDEDYMGPTLWASDLRIFGLAKSDREPPFNSRDTGGEGPGSHIDMLHRTPVCIGIAWEGSGNIYWTYSGSKAMFVRYDFHKDHGIGNGDHSDGAEWRYPVAGIQYVPNLPSHMVFDTQKKLLYMVDSGNARVVSFDPASATQESRMPSKENLDQLGDAVDVAGGTLQELVPKSYGMVLPSGLALHDQQLYVSDSETGTIHKFSLSGEPRGQLVLRGISGVQKGSLAGLTFGPDGKLYMVDMAGNRVLRLENDF